MLRRLLAFFPLDPRGADHAAAVIAAMPRAPAVAFTATLAGGLSLIAAIVLTIGPAR